MGVYRIAYTAERGWGNGTAVSKYAAADATYDPASTGIDPFRFVGELSPGYAKSDIGGSTVVDLIKEFVPAQVYNASTLERTVFGYGDAGHIYQIDGNDDSISDIKTVSSSTTGMAVAQDYLFYARQSNIGRYGPIDQASPTFGDTYIGSLTSSVKGVTIPHPMHAHEGTLYFGDANLLKLLEDPTAGTATVTTVLTLDDDMVITSIVDNGSFLYIGASTEANSQGPGVRTKTRLYIWNFIDAAPTLEIAVDDPYIHKLFVHKEDLFIFGENNVYILANQRTSGKGTLIFDTLDTPTSVGGVDSNQGIMYWKQSGYIRAFGTNNPRLIPIFHNPQAGTGTDFGAIYWPTATKLYVSDSNKLYSYGSGQYPNAQFKTHVITESQEFMLQEVRLFFSGKLSSGDDIMVSVFDEAGTEYEVYQVTHEKNGAVTRVVMRSNQFAKSSPKLTSCQFGIKFKAGTARLREAVFITQATAQP